MATEQQCIEALQTAAQRLGGPPTKAQYEQLDIMPSASTVFRHCGGWNDAKEQAGLETNFSRGSRVDPKPDDVDLPEGMVWEELSQDQRWHYKNRDRERTHTKERERRYRAWVREQKAQRGCSECGLSEGVCLDFHHRDDEAKWLKVSQMVTYGYRKERLAEEMKRCNVFCANCDRQHHADGFEEIDWTTIDTVAPGVVDDALSGSDLPDKYEARRTWVAAYKEARGCSECSVDDAPCLSFHHPPECEKTLAVSQLVIGRYSNERVATGINKCDLLCANCHRRHHVDPIELDAD